MLTKQYGTLYAPKKSNRLSLSGIEAWRAGFDDNYRKSLARIAEQLFKFDDEQEWAIWLFKFVNVDLLEFHYPDYDQISAKEWAETFLKSKLNPFTRMNSDYGNGFLNALFYPERHQHWEKKFFLPWLEMIRDIIYIHAENIQTLYREYEPKQGNIDDLNPLPPDESMNAQSLANLISDTEALIELDPPKKRQSYRESGYYELIKRLREPLITTDTSCTTNIESTDESPNINTPLNNEGLLNISLSAYLISRSEEGKKNVEDKPQPYLHSTFFKCFQYSFDEKEAAVYAFRDAIMNKNAKDLHMHLGALRNGKLGRTIRAFVKNGYADELLGTDDKIHTVRDFITALEQNYSPSLTKKN
ncbi:MAG: hypothetical protein LCH30_03680 [Proteobacteria bacterium]|nr:hypothetical protein [Pseudomonadota bacterium]